MWLKKKDIYSEDRFRQKKTKKLRSSEEHQCSVMEGIGH